MPPFPRARPVSGRTADYLAPDQRLARLMGVRHNGAALRPGWRAGPGRLALLAAAAGLACAALAGCAGAAAGTGKTPAVCAQAGSITHLVIHRVNGLPQNHERFSFPALITVTSPSRAQSVARALCALPAMPSGTYACPADWAITYRGPILAARTCTAWARSAGRPGPLASGTPLPRPRGSPRPTKRYSGAPAREQARGRRGWALPAPRRRRHCRLRGAPPPGPVRPARSRR